MSFASIWSTFDAAPLESVSKRVPTTPVALDFLILSSFSGVREIRMHDLRSPGGQLHHQTAGQGAVSSVQHAMFKNKPVAIKRSRVASISNPDDKVFQSYLQSLIMELRVATQPSLQTHPNIVDLLGYGLEGINGPDAFLVFEYAEFGPLDQFVMMTAPVPAPVVASLVNGVAQGLHALHQIRMCHGDVKPGNVLVFRHNGALGWTAKLCDFGQVVIAEANDDAPVRCNPGTPAYNAPELRDKAVSSQLTFTIASILKTDVYSFGLLVWQCINDGHYPMVAQEDQGYNLNTSVAHINNPVLEQALRTVQKKVHHTATRDLLCKLLLATLQQDALQRQEIGRVLEIFDILLTYDPEFSTDSGEADGHLDQWNTKTIAIYKELPWAEDEDLDEHRHALSDDIEDVFDVLFDEVRKGNSGSDEDENETDGYFLVPTEEDGLSEYFHSGMLMGDVTGLPDLSVFDYSLFEILDIRLRAGVVGEMSETLQSRIVAELISIFEDSETFDETKKLQKAAASMMLGDCYIYGFGIEQDAKKMLWKIWEAASAGLERARIWYPRLRQAFKGLQVPLPDSQWGMSHISSWPSTSFLPMLIQDNKKVRRQMTRQHVKPSGMKPDEIIQDDSSSDGEVLYLETFAEDEWDRLGVLHQAAWIGDQDTVGMLLHQGHAVNVTTTEGRTPLYYACLAGDLLMVKALLSYRADPTLGDRRGITPLHLCIMFDDQSAEPAVSLLVQNGGCLSARTTTTIRWRMYDLELKHEPLNWAIQTRNKNLVSLLIKAGAPLVGLNDAVRYFLPEIMEILLSHGTTLDDDMPLADALSCLDRPHRHWLLHGNERLSCIHQTLHICEKYGCELKSVLPRDIVPGRSFTFLGAKIITAQMEEDFVLVIECIRRGCDVKEAGSEGSDALALAIRRDRRSYGYLELLDLLIQRYSAEELNQLGPEGDSYLLTAIEYKSPEALELLLRYGADPNLRAGFTKESPFEACIHHIEDQPSKFLQLLINYGADALRSGPRTREFFEIVNPNLFRQTFSKLEALFELGLPKETVMEYVHGALRSWFIPSGPFQERDGQRWAGQLLCHPKVHSIINERDADGLCLLHHAVIDLIPANVSLLLEAGAKSDEVINGPETVFTALHLVILYGRLLAVKSKRLERFQRRRQGYFQVATLLLEDYRAIKSEWFAGITKLHIACYLRLRSEIRKALAEGYDPNARGRWPTNGDLVTAKELFLGSCSPPLDGPYLFLLRERDLDFIQGVSRRRHHELQIDSDSMVRSMFGWQ